MILKDKISLNIDEQTILHFNLEEYKTKEELIDNLDMSIRFADDEETKSTVKRLVIKIEQLPMKEIKEIDLSDSLYESKEGNVLQEPLRIKYRSIKERLKNANMIAIHNNNKIARVKPNSSFKEQSEPSK